MTRFPDISQDIFDQLRNKHLVKWTKVSRRCRTFLDKIRPVWIRKIKKYDKNQVGFKDAWTSVVEKIPIKTLKQLAIAMEAFYRKNLAESTINTLQFMLLLELVHLSFLNSLQKELVA